MKRHTLQRRVREEAIYWDKFEEKAQKYGIGVWVDYQKANTEEIPFINFSTDPEIDRLYLGKIKDMVISRAGKGRILDLGCGAGWLCLELARRGAKVKGIDISSQRIKIARDYAKKEGVNIDYSIRDIEDYDWVKDGKYDAIVNWNSFHHIEKVEKILECVCKSLKKGGLFVSWDHLGDNLFIRLARKVAALIPGYYDTKREALGSVHSEREGLAKVRLHKDVIEQVFKVEDYQSRFIFVHLIPPLYKFLKHKLHIPFPKDVLRFIMKLSVEADLTLSRFSPGLGTYSFVVAIKK